MARLTRTFAALAVAGSIVAGAGFVIFAETVRRLSPSPTARADGIVVLTGDEERISTGVRLLVEGRARRLLISGVNPATRVPTELKRRLEGSDQARRAMVACCVDIGREALNTSGNADEALAWARAHGFRNLLVVTSGYHMLRSLSEFGRAMPHIQLQGYPVTSSRTLRFDAWWRHWPTARLLAGEYLKLLRSTAVMTVSRLVASGRPIREPDPPAPREQPSASASTRFGQ